MSTPVERPEGEAYPPVPLTLEGASVLHQMLRLRWADWKALPCEEQKRIADQASYALSAMESRSGGQSAVYSLLGHKGDLLLIHFRNSFDELSSVENGLARLALWDYLEPAHSYLSVVELGLYESTVKVYRGLVDRGIEPFSEEWNREIQATIERQRSAMYSRLFPEIPNSKYLCFYPMDRKRGEARNWYTRPMTERQRMMHEHGLVGRRYAGEVKQIITGSIGFDDWEWGVDLFADDALVFKRLIYEMRFDEVSAVYAAFGSFFVGVRRAASDLPKWLVTSEP